MTAGARVLVVDDDPSILEFVGLALTEDGFEVVTARDGAAALGLADRAQPDLILLDLWMPIMDGWAFIQAYRQKGGRLAPVIALTAVGDMPQNIGQIEVDGYLAKPFDLDELLELVSRHTRRQ